MNWHASVSIIPLPYSSITTFNALHPKPPLAGFQASKLSSLQACGLSSFLPFAFDLSPFTYQL
jgi:hypothetical protein